MSWVVQCPKHGKIISEYRCEGTTQLKKHSEERQTFDEICFLYEDSELWINSFPWNISITEHVFSNVFYSKTPQRDSVKTGLSECGKIKEKLSEENKNSYSNYNNGKLNKFYIQQKRK